MKKAKFKLNVIILLAQISSICNKNYGLVIDEEYLSADIYYELKKINNKIEILNKRQNKLTKRIANEEQNINKIKKEMVTEEILKKQQKN